MEINLKTLGDVTVVELQGRFDAYTAPPLKQKLSALVDEGRVNVVVHLGGVDFVDSTGLATLVSIMKRCRQGGGDLRLAALPPPVRVIFELARLDKAFDILPDEAAAVARFGV